MLTNSRRPWLLCYQLLAWLPSNVSQLASVDWHCTASPPHGFCRRPSDHTVHSDGMEDKDGVRRPDVSYSGQLDPGTTLLPSRSIESSGPTWRGERRTSGSFISLSFFLFPTVVTSAFPWLIKGKAGHPTSGIDWSHIDSSNKHTASHQRLRSYLPLSAVYNPYYKLSAGNTSSPKLNVGTFGPNQYNPCVLLAHHLSQTCNNINLLIGVYSKHQPFMSH